MKRIASILAIITSFIIANAAINANEALSNTAKTIGDTECLTASFVATASDGVSTSGTLMISHEKFRMVTSEYGAWYNGSYLWSYYKQNGETSLTAPTASELMEINPFYIVNNYAKHYSASLVQEKQKSCDIRLTAKTKNEAVKSAVITIDTKSWMPSAIKATFSNGASISIAISNIETKNIAPKKSMFEYPESDYPGVEIIDLR